MENLDTRLLEVNCLFYDKNDDERFIEYDFPIVQGADEYRRLIETRDISIVIVNLIDISHQDINALAESKRLKGDKLTLIAIDDGNLHKNTASISNRNLAFNKVLPKETDSNRIKFAITYFISRNKLNTLIENRDRATVDIESNTTNDREKNRSEHKHIGFTYISKIAIAVAISVLSIIGKNGFFDNCRNSLDPACISSSKPIDPTSNHIPVAMGRIERIDDPSAPVRQKEGVVTYTASELDTPKMKTGLIDEEILAFSKFDDKAPAPSGMRMNQDNLNSDSDESLKELEAAMLIDGDAPSSEGTNSSANSRNSEKKGKNNTKKSNTKGISRSGSRPAKQKRNTPKKENGTNKALKEETRCLTQHTRRHGKWPHRRVHRTIKCQSKP